VGTLDALSRAADRAQARAQAHADQTTAAQAAQQAAAAPDQTYTEVRREQAVDPNAVTAHPDQYAGTFVIWGCTVLSLTSSDIQCQLDSNDTVVDISLSSHINTSQVINQESINVGGTIAGMVQGTNAFGAAITQIQVNAEWIQKA